MSVFFESENDKLRVGLTNALAEAYGLPYVTTKFAAASIFDIIGGTGSSGTGEGSDDTISGVTTEESTVTTSGTTGNDTISAPLSTDGGEFFGRGGDDVIYASNGADTIYGGTGVVDSTDGNDLLLGFAGNDLIYGNSGDDTLRGGDALIEFGLGDDTIYGGSGSDSVMGDGGDDWLSGGGNIVNPEDAADTIYGGQGSDIIYGNGGDDFISGGAGEDEATYDGQDTVYGGLGNDTINGGGEGSDLLYGQLGNDLISGGGIVSEGGGTDTIYGGDGSDTLYGETEGESSGVDQEYVPIVTPEDQTAFDEALAELKVFPDYIYGGDGIDYLYGGEGSDTLDGGASNDYLYGNVGQDFFFFDTNYGVDVIFDFQPQFDTIQIKAGINGLNITTAADVLALASYIDDGLQIDLSNNGITNLILLEDYVYTDADSFVRRLPFELADIEIIA